MPEAERVFKVVQMDYKNDDILCLLTYKRISVLI